MEHAEHMKLIEAVKTNPALRRLYTKHLALDESISELSRRRFLKPEDEMQIQKLKKEKLLGVETMLAMLATSSRSDDNVASP